MKAKYVNPFTDYGFKKIFGEEASKPQLIDFLNSLLPTENQIKDLTFKNTEQLGLKEYDRKAVYDIYCVNERDERFIVELQKAKQNYFRERTIYYSTFPIQEQAEKGNWNYGLSAVFCVGILDFTFDDYETEPEKSEVVHTIQLKNQNGKVFYNKLTFIYLEMPNFKLTEKELVSRLDKWLYFIKNLEDFQDIPSIFKDEVFIQAFDKAEIARFGPLEMDSYQMSLKVFRDNKAVFDFAQETAYSEGHNSGLIAGIQKGKKEGKKEGIKEGIKEGKREGKIEEKKQVGRNLKKLGISIELIEKATGLSKIEIEEL
jgi:predicted transposase/invertase (TIGR01784 family)